MLNRHKAEIERLRRHCGRAGQTLFLGPSLTDDGKIELLPDGIEPVKKVHPAGRNVLVEVGKYSLRQVRPHRVDGGSTGKIQCRQVPKAST